ncbi:beta-ketoacyl synthase N-terminal-like domain-containing protein [Salinispora vitiensis]|uniref:beta-ketoacyl synthase N-terminal-like domain-containing protein n=1 Tax=Salinispora vitiensis TaxID=999544 RepID=UPI00037199F8|nr:beta-ketoacyl synthase N-terminal-like domain-containing protein [Salinispora vitiensis]
MAVAITGYDLVSCLGSTRQTFDALLAGQAGVSPLRFHTPAVGVGHGYQILDGVAEAPGRAASWLADCVATAVRRAGLSDRQRVSVVIGTGLRDLRAVERWSADDRSLDPSDIDFTEAVRRVLPDAPEVLNLVNACAASGHALAVGQDILVAGDVDAVVVAGVDATTESMLAMIGRVASGITTALRPFDRDRTGVLLGEGAVAVVLEPAGHARGAAAGVLGVGLSCDAAHETAPDPIGIRAAIQDAHDRAGVRPADIDLVITHGTGTALNDPTEAKVLAEVFAGISPGPIVTGVKGAIGHTSGAAALMSLVFAIEALRVGLVPPIAGLHDPIPEARGLRLVSGAPVPLRGRVAQINSFGFGGVNAVAVLEVNG